MTKYRLVEKANRLYTIEQKGVFVWKSIFDKLKDWDNEPEYTYDQAMKKVKQLIQEEQMKLARLNHKPKYIYPPFPEEAPK